MGTAIKKLSLFCVCAALAVPLGETSAQALVVQPPVYGGTTISGPTDGGPSFGGGVVKLATDQKAHDLYAISGEHLYKFDVTTNQSSPFSALGKSTIDVGTSRCCGDLSVDNSGTATQGRIYAMNEQVYISSYLPSGEEVAEFKPNSGASGLCGAASAPDGYYWVNRFESSIQQLDPATGATTGKAIFANGVGGLAHDGCEVRIDSHGNFYLSTHWQTSDHPVVLKYSPSGQFIYSLGTGNVSSFDIDRSDDFVYVDEGSKIEMYSSTGSLLAVFGEAPEGGFSGLSGSQAVTVDPNTHDVYVADYGGIHVFTPGSSVVLPDVVTDKAIPTPTSASLRGTINPSGGKTKDCFFEWGETTAYGTKPGELGGQVPCEQGTELEGSADLQVSASITGLTKGETYNFRLVGESSSGAKINGVNRSFTAQGMPNVVSEFTDGVKGDAVKLNAEIDPEDGVTNYIFEYGPTTTYGNTAPVSTQLNPIATLTSSIGLQTATVPIYELALNTEYHFRVVASNDAGTTVGPDHTFHTYPPYNNEDTCQNALARQQTGAVLLGACRAYELVSASNAGGYNVESDLIPGQDPLPAFPGADGKVLYGVSDGGIPNSGSPTDKGVDPYVATRDPETGWSTRYVGIPADGTPSAVPFASTFLAADEGLDTLAFSGDSICSPCFSDGSSGIPLRLPNGELVQGMKGSIPQPSATRKGVVREPLSADGNHFVFGSARKFEPSGNEGTVSMYDRNLGLGTTQVVSTLPDGTTMPGQPGELAISSDGSRIVIGEEVSTDSDGNVYWHLYAHLGTSPNTVDLTPGATSGALFAGMSADGSKVFFTTPDHLLSTDTDTSADIYEADVGGGGSVSLSLVSRNGSSPSNSDCSAVAFAGGSGVAANGSIYFLSPEVLQGAAAADQPNVYVLRPGEDPEFVATIDTSVGKPSQSPPARPINDKFLTALSSPETLAVDESTGDVYVTEDGAGRVARYTAAGAPRNFAVPGGSNKITGLELGGAAESEIAVDNAPSSPFKGDLYARKSAGTVGVYAPNGEEVGHISGFGEACGIAIDQSTGVVYVGDYSFGGIHRLEPAAPSGEITKADYDETGLLTAGMQPCQVAADTAGHVYASQWSSGPLKVFSASEFEAVPPSKAGVQIAAESNALYTDSKNNDLYVSRTSGGIRVYDEHGVAKETLGPSSFPGSRGVTVNAQNHTVYAASGATVSEIGYVEIPYTPIDNPAVRNAVQRSGGSDRSDIQLTGDGDLAVFESAMPLTGFDSHGKLEIFRFNTADGALDCVSCAASRSRPPGDASLARRGLSLTNDGRVFFTSPESLVLRDTDEKQDVYEWSPGNGARLISSGTSPFDSGLLSASADGRDVYFFTRDSFVNSDHNGTLMKIYDAREGGGFFHVPVPPPCAASDECHGPGSITPPAPGISSLGGTPGNAASERCRKGLLRRHGKCVKRRNKSRHSKRHGRGKG
jgi:hypothetical protein